MNGQVDDGWVDHQKDRQTYKQLDKSKSKGRIFFPRSIES